MRIEDQPMRTEDQPTAPHLETRSQLFSLRLTEWGEEVGLRTISWITTIIVMRERHILKKLHQIYKCTYQISFLGIIKPIFAKVCHLTGQELHKSFPVPSAHPFWYCVHCAVTFGALKIQFLG